MGYSFNIKIGCLAGVFPVDDKTIGFFEKRKENKRIKENLNKIKNEMIKSDEGSFYSKIIKLDLSSISPTISGPNHVKKIQSVFEIEKKNIKIQKAYILSCVNSRFSDLEKASKILKNNIVHKDVKLYIR
jgi:homoaconitate hydratase